MRNGRASEKADKPVDAGAAPAPRAGGVRASEALLAVRGLEVALPGGNAIIAGVDLELAAGEVVTLLGPSGAGKTTLVRAVLTPDELRAHGFAVRWAERTLMAEAALVPQRGALFDHLDVAGNVALAQIAAGQSVSVAQWFEAVNLDAAVAAPGRSVGTLSGGQSQRVAIARTLASGRRIMVLDEPSAGLDALSVQQLSDLLVDQARRHQVGILVITHDLSLAVGASDRILFLDPSAHGLSPIAAATGRKRPLPSDERQQERDRLEQDVTGKLDEASRAQAPSAAGSRAARGMTPSAVRVFGTALLRALDPRLLGASLVVFRRALGQSLLKPFPFYLVVGALLGFAVLYVIAKVTADVRVAAMLKLVGGTYILALAPPLSAILFAATSGNAVNAWLGSMKLHRQVQALQGIGVPVERYLWAPAWTALVLAYLVTVVVFAVAMGGGGWVLFHEYKVPHAVAVLSSDFVDPTPGRVRYLVRGIWLVVAYAVGIASIAVSQGAADKEAASDVTDGMTSAVTRTTLLVAILELTSVMALFAWTGQ